MSKCIRKPIPNTNCNPNLRRAFIKKCLHNPVPNPVELYGDLFAMVDICDDRPLLVKQSEHYFASDQLNILCQILFVLVKI